MNRLIMRWMLMILTLAGCGSWSVAAAAQDAGTPVAAGCDAAPRTVDELVALFTAATPVPEVANDGSAAVPTGRVASAVLQAHVTETVEQAFTCLNAGDILGFLGLLTDEAIMTGFPWIGESLANGATIDEVFAPAPPSQEGQQTLIAVADIRAIAPDQAGAFAVFIDPASGNPGPDALYLTFQRFEDRWLIAGITSFSGE
jgi:hypothetical protein